MDRRSVREWVGAFAKKTPKKKRDEPTLTREAPLEMVDRSCW